MIVITYFTYFYNANTSHIKHIINVTYIHQNSKLFKFLTYFIYLIPLSIALYICSQDPSYLFLFIILFPNACVFPLLFHTPIPIYHSLVHSVFTVKQTRAKRRPIVNTNNAAAILAFAALNPHASSRQMEKKSGISKRSVLRILHQHKFHPYRMPLHQDLYGNDILKRVNFCNWIRRKMRTDVLFL